MSDATKKLRELLAKASLPPWEHRQGDSAFKGWPVASFGTADDNDGHWVSVIGRGASEGPTRGADNDARLVAALRNAAPALLDVIEAAQAFERTCDCSVDSGCPEAEWHERLTAALAGLERLT